MLTQHTDTPPSLALGNEGWSSTAAEKGLVQATNPQFNTSPKYPKCVLWSSPKNDVKCPRRTPATLIHSKGKLSHHDLCKGKFQKRIFALFQDRFAFSCLRRTQRAYLKGLSGQPEVLSSWGAEPRAAEAAKLFHLSNDQQ